VRNCAIKSFTSLDCWEELKQCKEFSLTLRVKSRQGVQLISVTVRAEQLIWYTDNINKGYPMEEELLITIV